MLDKDLMLKNSECVKNINDFASHKIDNNNNVFVCMIGENSTFANDVINMDGKLRGSFAYNRLSALPMLPPDKVGFYEEKYNGWIRSFKKKAVVNAAVYNEKQSEILGSALLQTLEAFRKAKKNTNDSIEKNFIMKLLFWYDFVESDLAENSRISNGIKIVGENVSKLQEYLFFYLLALTGADVMLLQNKTDLDLPSKSIGVSARVVLGHMGNTNPPAFTKIIPQPSMGRRNTVTQPTPQQNGNVKVTIPPRSGRQSTVSQPTPQQNGNVRVTIPPRSGRQNTVSQPTPQQNGNVRVTIPPRSGRQSTVTQPTPPQNSNVRITMPQRPDRQSTVIQTNVPQQSPPYGSLFGPNGFGGNQSRASAPQPRAEKSYEELAQLASSVVQIFGVRKKTFYIGSDNAEIVVSGSGIMIAEGGYILTNFHVARETSDYLIRIENDDNVYPANTLVKYHSDYDLAIIKIERRLSPLPIYRGQKPLVRGQKVVAIGSPKGLFNTVSDGIISGFRKIDGVDMVQFTAPISSGSSGGAILNMYGEVIGISTAGIDEGQNINFAVGYETILNFTRGITSQF